jgi:hypothetical protein
MLIHQIPPKPDYLRVKVRRRLLGLGAVALKSTVYVLPLNESTLEDFHWLRREIVSEQGEATIVTARMVDGVSDQQLMDQFRAVSDSEYAELLLAIAAAGEEPAPGESQRLRRQLEAIEARDHFGAAGRSAAKEALHRLEGPDHSTTHDRDEPSVERPRGATWVTRKGVFVDRIGSAWLIRRFIDAGARFKFVAPERYRPEPGELRFDMFEGEFTHIGGNCTFETLLDRFQLTDERLAVLGEIVHDIDCKDQKFGRPEADWVATMLRGVAAAHAGDGERIEAGAAVFDALYAGLPVGGKER